MSTSRLKSFTSLLESNSNQPLDRSGIHIPIDFVTSLLESNSNQPTVPASLYVLQTPAIEIDSNRSRLQVCVFNSLDNGLRKR